jgi:hypothetical protein
VSLLRSFPAAELEEADEEGIRTGPDGDLDITMTGREERRNEGMNGGITKVIERGRNEGTGGRDSCESCSKKRAPGREICER